MKIDSIRRAITWQAIAMMAIVCITCRVVYAHEMWIQASKSIVDPGAEVSLNLYVGRKLKGDDQPYNPRGFQRYRVTTATAEVPIEGHYGDVPAGRVAPVAEGLNIVSYHSNQMRLRFKEADKWQQYLEYEGLDKVAQFYRQNDFPQQGLMEKYQRCSRALIWGTPQDAASLAKVAKQDRPIGMPLELFFLDNPFLDNASEQMRLKLIYLSEPIADIQVRVFYRSGKPGDDVVDTVARTDEKGMVTLPRFGPGDYLFNAVHLIPAVRDREADWQSYWASLSLSLQ